MRHLCCIGGLVLTILIGGWEQAASAQDRGSDLTALGLEELMDLEVIPIDVLGTHIHVAGEWMVGYRGSRMQMNTPDREWNADRQYMMRPTAMRMEMHMMEIMYGVTDRLTLMAMVPYRSLGMESQVLGKELFNVRSQGIGDLQVMGHYALYQNRADYLIGKLALRLPTGSIDARDTTPAGPDQRLPYPMQLGAGTPGVGMELSYIDQMNPWAWGIHATGTFWVGKNTHAYRPGPEFHVGTWITRRVTGWMAPLMHVDLQSSGNIIGADPALDPAMAPGTDPDQQDEWHVSLGPGLSFYVPGGWFEGQRWALEVPFLVYEGADGGPLEHTWQVSLTWQWTF